MWGGGRWQKNKMWGGQGSVKLSSPPPPLRISNGIALSLNMYWEEDLKVTTGDN